MDCLTAAVDPDPAASIAAVGWWPQVEAGVEREKVEEGSEATCNFALLKSQVVRRERSSQAREAQPYQWPG